MYQKHITMRPAVGGILRTGICIFLTSLLLTTALNTAEASVTSLKFGMVPYRSDIGNEQRNFPIINAIEKNSGVSFQWIASKGYSNLIENLRTQKVDVAYLGPFSYIEAQDGFGVRLIARTLAENKSEFYQSRIITHVASGLNSLEDLKGKSFSFTDPKSTSGFLCPKVGLLKNGLRLDDFSKVMYVKLHVNSLLAVLNRQVDAGAVSSSVWKNLRADFSQIKILWQSDPIYRNAWVARKNFDDNTFYRIQKAILMIGHSEDSEQILKNSGIGGFVKGRDSDYDNVREMRRLLSLTHMNES